MVYAAVLPLCLLLAYALSLVMTCLQERAQLQLKAESVSRQMGEHIAVAMSALGQVRGVSLQNACIQAQPQLAAIVQSTPAAVLALSLGGDGRGCASVATAFDVSAMPAGTMPVQFVQTADGHAVLRLRQQSERGLVLLDLDANGVAQWLKSAETEAAHLQLIAGTQSLDTNGRLVALDETGGGGLVYRVAVADGLLSLSLHEPWSVVLWRSLVWRLDTLLVALLAGLALCWALQRQRMARHSSAWEIAQGIRNREFFTHYQPIVTADMGECVGVEVLARWRHPVQGAIRSELFIAAAADAGLLVPLTRYLIRRVTKELSQVVLPPGFFVGINIAAEHLGMPDLVEDCKLLLAVLREKKAVLVLEVSERFPLPEHRVAQRVVQDLRQMGVKLALDDFGIGHADRNYLRRWGFDYLKVEKGYVSALGKDSFRANILDGLLQTSQQLGVQVIVKGVENQGQQNYLLVKGFEYLQGFYFGKPMTLNHFRQWLYSGIAQDRKMSTAAVAGGRQEAGGR